LANIKALGVEKAAMLMMAINQETASKIFELLEDEEIKEILKS
jgi:flagellar motor switch protein FliG